MRLPRRARAVALLLTPGLVLLVPQGDRAEAIREYVEDVQPIEFVQLALNLTMDELAAESLRPALDDSLSARGTLGQGRLQHGANSSLAALTALLSQVPTQGLPSLNDPKFGTAFAIILLIGVFCTVVFIGFVVSAFTPSPDADLAPPPKTRPDVADEDPAAEEEEEVDGNDVDLPLDIYSTVMQGILRDGVAIMSGHPRKGATMAIHKFRMVSVLMLLGANYMFQFGILAFVYSFVVTASVAHVQTIYKEFRQTCFNPEGVYLPTACHTDFKTQLDNLCGLVFTYTWFMFLVLVIWSMAMVREFRGTERICRVLWNIDTTTHFDHMVKLNHGQEHVTNLTPQIRILIFLVVMLPKILITVILGCLGTVWLSSTSNLTDVILNSVALEFIIQIDELLFDAVVPTTTKKEVGNFKLTLRDRHDPGTFTQDPWMGYLGSLLYLFLTVGLPPIYMTVGQHLPFISVMPDYNRAEVSRVCQPMLEQSRKRVCVFGQACFP
mmetsp:Transcript_15560/g.48984  ORF Transcript_15560/g.48984 Transcript_15560/m.48984 type:complete len:496 (-) Transcript_15560:103-1590(-)|eukprot:CAMPEP_0204568670 /NCGR_PEP_ID=MMETSP0661-20131031/37316_1 /ASSEMBLY_ACC=CAM_ASM_000606 /TAXON_ID=109239 /ORGANISM="Alexandrium margalefi, Strain AMGDE01CS-322" /LENGTH=495 /DNA_ID=CAMNT_0051576715 /DNA_START=66 /DNA_END=1553 /DNA_ORIENTATION=-